MPVAMASSTIFSVASPLPRPTSSLPTACSPSLRFPTLPIGKVPTFSLSSSKPFFFGTSSFTFPPLSPLVPTRQQVSSLAVFAAKGYKMKTHKASAKRFRVTGKGKIMRRRAGKQHLLAKKNTKRKLRLSKLQQVDRSDYDNVIGALPYLKVNRNAP